MNTFGRPVQIGPLKLRNPIIKAATFEGMAPGGVPSPALTDHHVGVARGGAGMTTVAYCSVSDAGRTFGDQMVMTRDLVGRLSALTSAVHAEGAAVSLQLGHCGFFTKHRGRVPMSASWQLNAYGVAAGVPIARAMNARDLAQVTREFATAASLAVEAGFDAVEIHLGHGYLLSQFISPATNRRRDGYGGSVEKRARLPREVLRAVRAAVGNRAAVLAKVNLDDGFEGGLELAESIETAQLIEADGATDALVLSGGFTSRSAMYLLRGGRPLKAMVEVEKSPVQKLALKVLGPMLVDPFPFEPLFFLPKARQMRAALTMPLALLGGVTSGPEIQTALDEGFELVQMGRALIQDPGLPNRLAAKPGAGSHCVHCNICITEMDRPGGVRCVLVPAEPAAAAAHAPSVAPRTLIRSAPRRVLLTGAFGGVGRATLEALTGERVAVRVTDLDTPTNRKLARDHDHVLGDIRDRDLLERALEGCDAVIHLAALLPPMTEERPELAWDINVGATQALIELAGRQARPPTIIYASSVATYGPRFEEAPPRRADEQLRPSDHYSHQKASCETLLRASTLPWVIARVGAAMPLVPMKLDPGLLLPLFRVRADNRMHAIHGADLGLALARCVGREDIVGKTLLLGGGPSCRVRHRDLMEALSYGIGMPVLPDEALGDEPFYTDWLDTEESQRLLDYQHHDWRAIREGMAGHMRPFRLAAAPLRPVVRAWMSVKARARRAS